MRFARSCGCYAICWRRKTFIGTSVMVVLTIYALHSIIQKQMHRFIGADFRKCMNGDNAAEHVITHIEGRAYVLTLNCIQRTPDFASQSKRVIPLETHLSEPFLRLPKQMVYTQRVIILSPVRDAADRLEVFANLLSTLSYPHNLISVHFGEDGSHDDTIEVAKDVSHQLVHKFGFANATIVKLNIKGNNTTRLDRHFPKHQTERRSHLGKVRNLMMEYGLQSEEWILWIDSDVISFRADLIQQFLYSNKDVMVASTLFTYNHKMLYSTYRSYVNYDLNTFREVIHNDAQYKIWLFDLKSEGREVPVDYVGGCTLMLRADCYREGLRFTEVSYKPMQFNLHNNGVVYVQLNIETEGLAKFARDIGLTVYGLPHLEVLHQ